MSLYYGLQAWYDLNETVASSGSVWRSKIVTPTHDLTAKAAVTSAAGKIGTALSSSGGDALLYASSGTIMRVGSSDFTICGWVKRGSTAAWSIPFGKWSTASNNREYTVYVTSGIPKFRFQISSDGTAVTYLQSAAGEVPGTWQFVCARKSGTTLSLWVNTVRVDKVSVSTSVFPSNARFCIAGSYDGTTVGDTIAQTVDLVGHWNRALTDAEVSELYNAGAGLSLFPRDVSRMNITLGIAV